MSEWTRSEGTGDLKEVGLPRCIGQWSSLPGKLALDPKACPMGEKPDGLMGPMAILGISDKRETNRRNIRKIVCGNDCVEYKVSSCMPQLPH
jgi:hypothetical protein